MMPKRSLNEVKYYDLATGNAHNKSLHTNKELCRFLGQTEGDRGGGGGENFTKATMQH